MNKGILCIKNSEIILRFEKRAKDFNVVSGYLYRNNVRFLFRFRRVPLNLIKIPIRNIDTSLSICVDIIINESPFHTYEGFSKSNVY